MERDTKETEKIIADCDAMTREANMKAMRATGWQKAVWLWLARVWSKLGDVAREIHRDELRGKYDTYHDEY